MRLTVTADAAQVAAAAALLEDLADRAGDTHAAGEAIAADFGEISEAIFATEGAFAGRSWAPLTAEWAARRRAEGRGTAILRMAGGEGGALYASLTAASARGAIRRIGADTVTLGTSRRIAHAHHTGEGRLPARPLLPPDRLAADRWADLVRDHLLS